MSPFQASAFANDQFERLKKEISRQIESVDNDREMLGSIDLCSDVLENGVLKNTDLEYRVIPYSLPPRSHPPNRLVF